MAKKTPQEPNFETALAELEKLVNAMEAGELSLEESLRTFEQGIALTRRCEAALREAEQKVEMLAQASVDAELVPFQAENKDS